MNKNLAFAIMSAWKNYARDEGRRESEEWREMVEALNYLRRYGHPSKPAQRSPITGKMIGGGDDC